jgi:ATP-dependent DNA helicase RecG
MVEWMKEAGLPEPEYKEEMGGFSVYFHKDIYTEENLIKMGLNKRQIKAVMYVKERGSINLSSFKAVVPAVSEKTLYRDLQELVSKGVLKELGEKKGRRYELV